MTIRRTAYDLCKTVWDSPKRSDVQELITDINTVSDPIQNLGNSRSSYGMVARQVNAQLAAYLHVHDHKEEIAEKYPPLRWTKQTLSNNERELLFEVHCEIAAINRKLVTSLVEVHPSLENVLNPYIQYQLNETPVETITICDPDKLNSLAARFAEHPSMKIAEICKTKLDELIEENETLSEQKLIKGALDLDLAIKNAGPLKSHKALWQMSIQFPHESRERYEFHLLAAITSIRASLWVLDELIFQALLVNQLPLLNEDNVIELSALTGSGVSTGYTIKFQPDSKSGFGAIGLVLTKLEYDHHDFDLGIIEVANFQSSQDFGDLFEVVIREVDKNLNPYNRLIRTDEYLPTPPNIAST